MRTTIGALALLSLTACVNQPAPLVPQSISFDDGVRALQDNDEARATVVYFARLASAKNPDGMILGYDSVVREAVDERRMRDFLGQAIVPFFADYQGMDQEDDVISVDFPGGRRGEIHNTYVVTHSNEIKPVMFTLVRDNGHFRIAAVSLNACMAGKNPDATGRCR